MELQNISREAPPARRFVILWHALRHFATSPEFEGRSSHFDLMFEEPEFLVTFELPRIPIPSERLSLRRLADHRRHYLDYEGPLSPGKNGEDRGHVTRWAAGTFTILKQSPEKRVVEMTSERFSAQLVLKPILRLEDLQRAHKASLLAGWNMASRWEMYVSRWSLKESQCSKT